MLSCATEDAGGSVEFLNVSGNKGKKNVQVESADNVANGTQLGAAAPLTKRSRLTAD